MVMSATYPVHLDASLDRQLSRWLWLVKLALAIPHYIVLFFLWITFLVLSVVAFVAIIFTGRYPRGIFDFNVGVLRWSWRLTYYTYGALATDRYPPFSLQERPDYPRHLDVEYPEHLSGGLVWVKSWLLAIPDYLVIGLFLGGAYIVTDAGAHQAHVWNTGLITLLALIAAVVLLFTGRYPTSVFDLVLGLNRWVLRVTAYAGLMTDQYPPFRLDQGGADPDVARLTMGAAAPMGTAPAPPATPGAHGATGALGGPAASARNTTWSAGRIIAVVAGSVFVLGGLAGLGLGGVGVVVDRTVRDSAGFLTTPSETFTTSSYAVTSERIDINTDTSSLPERLLGDARVTAVAPQGSQVFVGVASSQNVRQFLRGVPYKVVSRFDNGPVYRSVPGTAAASRPASADIWVASSSGAGTQKITWPVKNGTWTIVVMNADGARGVSADVSAGLTAPVLSNIASALVWTGAAVLLVGVVLLALALLIRPSGR